MLIHIRSSLKFLILLGIGTFLVIGFVTFIYRPIYSVTLNGEQIGYTENKRELQNRINEYMKNGTEENVAFVQIDELPEYKMCLLKKGYVTNDDEIFSKVTELGTTFYKYYTVLVGDEEKVYVGTKEQAEEIITGLKNKKSSNQGKLAYKEKYETSLKDFTAVDKAISDLYVKPVVVGYANTSSTVNMGPKIDLGIKLTSPISGVITSRFGARSGGTHTGLDIAGPTGTPIMAAAAGTVTHSGYRGGYGKLVIITHANGVQTYYAHCNELKVEYGQQVAQGEVIATRGSTGNSTGPHLHLEIRVNGVAQNPQNYLY